MVRTGATFKDAAAEYMRWLEHDRTRKPSTLRDYHPLEARLVVLFDERDAVAGTDPVVDAGSACRGFLCCRSGGKARGHG